MVLSATVTFASIIEDVIGRLQGYGVNNDQFTTLTKDISPTDTTFTVADGDVVSRGILEVGTELMQVISASDLNVTVPVWGRGFRNTQAEAHTVGERVTFRPTYPRAAVSKAINEAVTKVYPLLYSPKVVEITPTGSNWQYQLPADCRRVLKIEASRDAISGWVPIEDWDLSHGANTTDFPSGVMVSFPCAPFSGTRVRIWYAAEPVKFSSLNDTWTTTGLPDSCYDVILLAAAADLVPWLDTGRLPVESAEADALDNARQLGTAVNTAKDLRSQYQAALIREKVKLDTEYPTKARRVR